MPGFCAYKMGVPSILFEWIVRNSFCVFIDLFEKQRDRNGETDFSFIGSFPNLPSARVEPGQNQKPGAQLGSLDWVTGICLSHPLLPPRVHISWKLDLEAEPGLKCQQ